MSVTRYDVARHCKVSHTTVSNVINNTANKVSEDVRKRVLKGIRELGYVPDEAARRLRLSGSGAKKNLQRACIGFLIPENAAGGFSNIFFSTVLNGIIKETSGYGMRLTLDTVREDFDKEEGVPQIMQSWAVDALIISGMINPVFVSQLLKTKLPVIQLGETRFSGREFDSISGENYKGGYEAVKHLIGEGHRNIAMIRGPQEIPSAKDRYKGYCDALAAAGIPYDESLVETAFLGSRPSGNEAMNRLMKTGKNITAVFAANDEAALGAKAAIETLGLKVPQDISLVGYDNLPISAEVTPALTTVDSNSYEMGRAAVKRLAEILKGANPSPVKIKLPSILVLRDSVKKLS